MMRPGMKNGETRRGPFSFSMIAVSAMPSMPPMPEPIITPVAFWSSSASGLPAGIVERLLAPRTSQRR